MSGIDGEEVQWDLQSAGEGGGVGGRGGIGGDCILDDLEGGAVATEAADVVLNLLLGV